MAAMLGSHLRAALGGTIIVPPTGIPQFGLTFAFFPESGGVSRAATTSDTHAGRMGGRAGRPSIRVLVVQECGQIRAAYGAITGVLGVGPTAQRLGDVRDELLPQSKLRVQVRRCHEGFHQPCQPRVGHP